MCIPSLFVHATKTTDKHSKERSKYNKHTKCSQCGKVVGDNDRVAAHVVSYPCFMPFCGWLTLKTTCKKCNNTKNAESSNGRWFISGLFGHNPSLMYVCFPFCCNYEVKD